MNTFAKVTRAVVLGAIFVGLAITGLFWPNGNVGILILLGLVGWVAYVVRSNRHHKELMSVRERNL